MQSSAGPATLSLCAQDLRGPALRLLALAERQAEAVAPSAELTAIAETARHLLDLADDMQEAAAVAAPSIVPEPVVLGALLREVIEGTAALLRPGIRNWRAAAEIDRVVLRADRRALAEVLGRVLARAAQATTDQDWIDIRLHADQAALTLVVEDEGCPLPSGAGGGLPQDRRGLGLGLTLARRLMQAQGGSLAVAHTPRVGSRVSLGFPGSAVLTGPERRAI
jgi:signal transduction histidine kinase